MRKPLVTALIIATALTLSVPPGSSGYARAGQATPPSIAVVGASNPAIGSIQIIGSGVGVVKILIDGQVRSSGLSETSYLWRTAAEANAIHAIKVIDDLGSNESTVKTANPTVQATSLTLGEESMYFELNWGTLAEANNMLEGIWPSRWPSPLANIGEIPKWDEDPFQDAYWRFYFYGLRPLSNLLYAYRTTGDSKYSAQLVKILKSYVAYDQTRTYNVLTWDNNHAAAYRAMVLVNLRAKLMQDNLVDESLDQGLKRSINKLAEFLVDSKHFEESHNHGFAEAAALLLIARAGTNASSSSQWRQIAIDRLKFLVNFQVGSDGVQIENSPFYHVFVLGLMVQIGNWAKAWEPSLSTFYWDNLRSMIRYAAYITQPDGYLPMIGATATTYMPSQDAQVYGSSQITDPEFKWVRTKGVEGNTIPSGSYFFSSAGQYTLRSNLQPTAPKSQTFVTFDAGPYRTEHSDLDALGINLYSDGRRLVSEAGLYTYTSGLERTYFHGTRAHNTVVVDGQDQTAVSGIPGSYGSVGESSWATAVSKLSDDTSHRRSVIVLKQGLTLVADRVYSTTAHTYSQMWHFPTDLSLTTSGASSIVTDSKSGKRVLSIRQSHPEELGVASYRGATNPLRGWESTVYGTKVPAWEVEYGTLSQKRSRTFSTLFQSGTYAGLPGSVTENFVGTENQITVCVGSDTGFRVFVPDNNKPVRVENLPSCPAAANSPLDLSSTILPTPPVAVDRRRLAQPAPNSTISQTELASLFPSLPRTEGIPVLLFHGLCDSPNCGVYDMTRSEFLRTILMLKSAGFQSIGIEKYDKFIKGEPVDLPAKPILLTFDDARLDAYRGADEILRQTGQRAVNYVISAKAEGDDLNFSNWIELASMNNSGRWDVQLHAGLGHIVIQCSTETPGISGPAPFYSCLKQVDSSGSTRSETIAEWLKRVTDDLDLGEARMKTKIPNYRSYSFAVPYGDFGQGPIHKTMPEATILMQTLRSELDRRYGLNWFVQASDPAFSMPKHRPYRYVVRGPGSTFPLTNAELIYAWLSKHSR